MKALAGVISLAITFLILTVAVHGELPEIDLQQPLAILLTLLGAL